MKGGADMLEVIALLAALLMGFVLGVASLAHHMETNAIDLYIEYTNRIRATRRCKRGR